MSLAKRAAIIHIIGDIVQSVGVMIAAFLIWWQPVDIGVVRTKDHPDGISKWIYADPLCTFLFTLLVIYTTWGTVRSIVDSVLLSVPDGLDAGKLRQSLAASQGVERVYDLHAFKVGQGKFLTAHCTMAADADAMETLSRLQAKAQNEFNFTHATFQLETPDYDSSQNHLSLGGKACGH